jgi:hypothetical protein
MRAANPRKAMKCGIYHTRVLVAVYSFLFMKQPSDFKILIACEESQTICKAFRKLGFEAFSCDLLPCSGGHPEWHAKADAIDMLYASKWDLVIAHPPCTRMANSGVMWLEKRNLWNDLDKATDFFNEFVKYGKQGNKIAIENPIPHKYAVEKIGKYSQVIQPYMFGHTERKATCLWLFGLPELKETNNVMEAMKKLPKNEQQRIHYLPPGKDRAKLRSKTFPGIAQAIATQYGSFLLNGY